VRDRERRPREQRDDARARAVVDAVRGAQREERRVRRADAARERLLDEARKGVRRRRERVAEGLRCVCVGGGGCVRVDKFILRGVGA
jgi:hypothetical protein